MLLELGIVFEECKRGARSGKGLRNPFVIQIESLAGYVEHIEDLLPPLLLPWRTDSMHKISFGSSYIAMKIDSRVNLFV